jgi:tetraacyldisaccharide 4'-kinase
MKFRLQDRVMFGVGPDRYEQGRKLEEKGAELFLLDDGFQHLPLFRDINILLMDASQPLGRESMLPAGNLREPVSAMDRADLLVITRLEASPATLATIEKLQDYPVFSAVTRLLGFRRLGAGIQLLSAQEIGPGPFYAFCGIGNPKAFFQDLKTWNIPIAQTSEFADHHHYDQRDALELEQVARANGAKALVTTEKDAQNLTAVSFSDLPVFIAVIEMELPQQHAFLGFIRERLAARSALV